MPDLCPHCGAKQPAVRVAFCPACRNDVDEPRLDPETGQPIRETVDLVIWYGIKETFLGWLRPQRLTASGVLIGASEGLQFVAGNGTGFEMRRITAARRLFPWSNAMTLIICYVIVFVIEVLVTNEGGPDKAWEVGALLSLPLLLLTVRLLIDWNTCWVRVEYLDPWSRPYVAHFTVGSFGQRLQGGGSRLCALFRQLAEQGNMVIPPVKAAEPATAADRPREHGPSSDSVKPA
jgi:hypothetical protein